MTAGPLSEFDRIDRYFKPLAAKTIGALDLSDDGAILDPPPNARIVVTTDTMVEGVHWLKDQSPQAVAQKLLRVNLSDLAAMGAKPWVYTLNTALASHKPTQWLEDFAAGLLADQRRYGIGLAGGDSVSTKGPVVLTVTAFGLLPAGSTGLRRSTAQPGDAVFVTGTIGDAFLGLQAMTTGLDRCPANVHERLIARFTHPTPRLDMGEALAGIAEIGACLDVSDGLLGDLAHIARESQVAIEIEMDRIPISEAAQAVIDTGAFNRSQIVNGGDDYELVFTARDQPSVDRVRARLAIPVTRIGTVSVGQGVRLIGPDGSLMTSPESWNHF